MDQHLKHIFTRNVTLQKYTQHINQIVRRKKHYFIDNFKEIYNYRTYKYCFFLRILRIFLVTIFLYQFWRNTYWHSPKMQLGNFTRGRRAFVHSWESRSISTLLPHKNNKSCNDARQCQSKRDNSTSNLITTKKNAKPISFRRNGQWVTKSRQCCISHQSFIH